MKTTTTVVEKRTRKVTKTVTMLNNSETTKKLIKIGDKSFPICRSAKGSLYIELEGKTGTYPLWIGLPAGIKIQGLPTRKFSTGRLGVLQLVDEQPKIIYVNVNIL